MHDIYVILTTYRRTADALVTVNSFLDSIKYTLGNIKWILTDDGSPEEHVQSLLSALPEDSILYRSDRKGTGHNMNWGINKVKALEGELLITLEDDWKAGEFSLDEYARLLLDHADIGMVRFGYLSPGLQAEVISRNDRLWWRTVCNGYQYRYTGHPALKHLRFYQEYAMHVEGRTPGMTELHMCGIVNSKPNGPSIVIPVYEKMQWGLFGHVGAESLADVTPGA